jgi:adenylosuccinate synthase
MPISIVVGGQFGSEGKGKVALHTARDRNAVAVVRVGGTNSGHTAMDSAGRLWALRQLPASVLAQGTTAVLPAGAIIDPEIFHHEVSSLGLGPDRVIVSPFASLITDEDKAAERAAGLIGAIGSTGSGTGAALVRRLQRNESTRLAGSCESLKPFIRDPEPFMREALDKRRWIVIEGSQGFGLSVLHGGYYPKATSRDTTAGTFLGEAGLSPIDVRDVTLVLRLHPIRVAGDSGDLPGETSWSEIARVAGLPTDFQELTTATKKVRRVGRFDIQLVRRAIAANNPTRIVLNHFDYADADVRHNIFSDQALATLKRLEVDIRRGFDLIGTGPDNLLLRSQVGQSNVQAVPKYSGLRD